ncbi:MAG: hypothetical protein RLY16_723 [Bacteroidota bacterium]|jgi:tRNA pseudouridine38-40 synthase
MHRYFIELSYNGAEFSGFQIQENANTVQWEVEQALKIIFKTPIPLTGSSRTDAGVNALCNFFQFDLVDFVSQAEWNKKVYNLNAILPAAIAIKRVFEVPSDWHCRFSAIYRRYRYRVYREKNPFLVNRALYFPYPLDIALLNDAAAILLKHTDFESFSKRNTQVFTHNCLLEISRWFDDEGSLVYEVQGNRFLRGMVRGLVGTMLKVGTGKLSLHDFEKIIIEKDQSKVDFSVPGYGLYLQEVGYPALPTMPSTQS